jgi:hypothetical protein
MWSFGIERSGSHRHGNTTPSFVVDPSLKVLAFRRTKQTKAHRQQHHFLLNKIEKHVGTFGPRELVFVSAGCG